MIVRKLWGQPKGKRVDISFDKDEVIDSIKDLYTGERKYIVWGISGGIVIALIALIIVCALPKKDKTPRNAQTVLTPDEEVLIPSSPQTEVKSVTSRNKDNAWGEKEKKQFFTVPSTAELDELCASNDFLIKDIMGAAP